ncbi:Polypeptide release factor 3 [Pseudoloma neurophilia]|uniref:Polypeptide release factor 3 n=1 Tax=Pseudoloma neurophilia TaxID=146866 RepID=A0A0R0M6N1_9MICR|nr:Polypeptide release factor 3 [Pseudoloma neurophilia]
MTDLENKRPTVAICLIGHVDAGKSTLNGRILYDLKLVDDRTIEKYKVEAIALGRESWYLSWLTDTSPAEREKGKTQEMCSTKIQLPSQNIILNDTPGHKLYVQDMIKGANQSDIALLLVSARKGEFQAGFLRSGQTREHVILSKAGGIETLIVVINKMDEANYDKTVFLEIVREIHKFLEKFYKSIIYVPIAGYIGTNILKESEKEEFIKAATSVQPENIGNQPDVEHNISIETLEDSFSKISLNSHNITSENLNQILGEIEDGFEGTECKEMTWYRGDSLMKILDNIRVYRKEKYAKCVILETGKNFNVIRLESGQISKNWDFISLPSMNIGKILNLFDDDEIEKENGHAGEILKIKTNCDMNEGDIMFDLEYYKKTSESNDNIDSKDVPILRIGRIFTCTFSILNIKNVISPGYHCLLHLRMSTKNARIVGLQKRIIDKGKEKIIKIHHATVGDRILVKIDIDDPIYLQIGDSFAIRDEDLTIGVGVIRKIIE